MSLEAALEANTSALNALLAHLQAQPIVTHGSVSVAPNGEVKHTVRATAPAAQAAPMPEVAKGPDAPTLKVETPAPTPAKSDAPKIDYSDVVPAASALVKAKGRTVFDQITRQFGMEPGKIQAQLKPEKYGEFKAALEAALAAE